MLRRNRPITAVAIPARDEAERIGACIEALNGQDGAQLDHIFLLVNNSFDDTAKIARSVRLHRATQLHIVERDLPPEQANAGFARRMAMARAAGLAGPRGVILTTDADGLVDPDWLAANLAALAAGADVVAGWVDLHPLEWSQIPTKLHEDDARECAYDALCDALHHRIDPDPADPAPRHTQHSGASIAVTAEAFALCGGVPPLRSGEDRALIAALRQVDARIRHSVGVHVTVSGRTEGRCEGGMADTIRRRLSQPDQFLDDRLEPALDCARRALCRAELRRAYDDPAFDVAAIADQLLMSPEQVSRLLRQPYFGMAWVAAEQISPALRRRPVPVTDLPEQMRAAAAILAELGSLALERGLHGGGGGFGKDHVGGGLA